MFGFNKKTDKSNLEDVLPVLAIEDDKIIMKDGRVVIGYEIEGVEMEKWTESEYNSLGETLNGALKGLQTHSIIQKIDVYYNKRYEKTAGNGYFENRNNQYFLNRPILFHKSYLFIISPTQRNVKTNSINTYFSFKKVLVQDPLNNIEKRMDEAQKQSKAFSDALGSNYNISCKRMDSEQLQVLYRQFLNMDFTKDPGRPYKAMENNQNYLVVGDKKVNVISLSEQAREVSYSSRNDYGVVTPFTYSLGIYLQTPHITVTSMWIEDTEKEMKRLDLEKKINESLGSLASQSQRIKETELDEFTEDIRANQKKVVNLSMYVILYGSSEQLRINNIETVISAIRSMNGAEGIVESYDNANLFFSCLPGAAANGFRWLLLPSDVGCCYMNFTTSYRGEKRGDYICDRFRNPVNINLFNRNLNNQNCIVIGPSGSGKSFTMGHFIIQRHEKGERQIIIDIGGTYKNIIEALGGQYFEYDPANPIEFNPFLCDKINGKYNLLEDKLNFLIALIACLWKDKGINKAEWSVLLKWIPEYYDQEKDMPSLKNFWKWLLKKDTENKNNEEYKEINAFFNVKEFLLILEPFVKGKYSGILNSERQRDISDYKLVCFDMAKVKDDRMLYPVVTMMLTEIALDVIRKYPDEIKYMSMDEAWAMLADSMGTFVEGMFRTLRKNNGSMTIITQGIDEIIESKVGKAIINNSETKIILNHTDKEQIIKLGTHLGFTQHELEKISSIRVNNTCRELFVKQGTESNIFTLEVSGYEHAVASSHPVERNHLKKLMEHYQNLPFAVDQWVEDRESGKLHISRV